MKSHSKKKYLLIKPDQKENELMLYFLHSPAILIIVQLISPILGEPRIKKSGSYVTPSLSAAWGRR
jgi:hypothetical protein